VTADDLLLWMSARREGSWQQFRGAVEALHLDGGEDIDEQDAGSESLLPIQHALRLSLECLAHVEFSSQVDHRWRVVPSSLALVSETDNAGVLCGARTPQTVEALRTLTDVHVEVSAMEGAPDCIILRCDSHAALVKAAQGAGLRVQNSASAMLLAAHGSIRRRQGWTLSELPPLQGWTVHRFSSSQRRWIESRPDMGSKNGGLFRFVLKHQRFYYIVKNGQCFRVPVQAGKYAVLRRKGNLLYDKSVRTLSVLPICRPPLLIERALVLCSGRLPTLNDRGRLEYRDVPLAIAQLTAEVLCQELG
jgi:hypothetical protein